MKAIPSSLPTAAGSSDEILSAKASSGSGLLRVAVPADAKVFVNGNLTTSTGTERQYESHGLQLGLSYSYNVRVEYTRNGETVTESKSVTLTAGSNELLAFASPVTEAVATTLQLRVPADARVMLSGAATKQTGEVREFVTTRLTPGQTWAEYTIVVELDADGELLKQEKTITLRGGETTQLTFDFADASAKLALRN